MYILKFWNDPNEDTSDSIVIAPKNALHTEIRVKFWSKPSFFLTITRHILNIGALEEESFSGDIFYCDFFLN